MDGKVFRLHSGIGKQNEHWFDSDLYNKKIIDTIHDPTALKLMPTSIPSPFARIDLVKTAFKYVVDKQDLDGDTAYHQLVSDCLDVGQIIFERDKHESKLKIEKWDRDIDLEKLRTSQKPKHKLLYETLDLFIKQDGKDYNFEDQPVTYIIKYNNRIIGATSPVTLFFTPDNDLNSVDIQFSIANGQDKVFDKIYMPLYKRDESYIKFLFSFFYAHSKLTDSMKEVWNYLELNLKRLEQTNSKLYNTILNHVKPNAEKEYANYEDSDTGTKGDDILILGCHYKKKTSDNSQIEQKSEFVINSTKINPQKYLIKPLALQNQFSKPYIYISGQWSSNNTVPYYDPSELKDRRLPETDDKYPYLTVSDFLEKYIIRLVYPINKEKYFDGNLQLGKENNLGYALPIKKLYFDFFGIEDLKRNLKMSVNAMGSITVTLDVPVKGGKVTFERKYDVVQIAEIPEPDESRNQGYILENKFSFSLFPPVKSPTKNHFRALLLDRDISGVFSGNKYDLYFQKIEEIEITDSNNTKRKINSVKETKPLLDSDDKRFRTRCDKESEGVTSQFYVLEDDFDFIEVKHSFASGILVPKFERSNGSDKYTFAIDFGTSNTHIESIINGQKTPQPFEILDKDLQLATLHDPRITDIQEGFPYIIELIHYILVPEKIDRKSDSKFPVRTAIGEYKNLNYNKGVSTLADCNIPFYFENKTGLENFPTKIKTDLKWLNIEEEENKQSVNAFLEELLFLIRNKVLLNGGNIRETSIIWFYPSSMDSGKVDRLEKIWQRIYRNYFSDDVSKVRSISESITPYYHFANGGKASSFATVVSIDIGGGTTDVVVYDQRKPKLLTSFKFAGNALYGDGYDGNSENNGFVLKYTNSIKSKITDNNLSNLLGVYNEISQDKQSRDIISFFFSLEKNKTIKEKKIALNFSEMLSIDKDLKIIFILFYSAIIYHIAKLLQAKGISLPRHITFSGMGSKSISILSSGNRTLESFTKIIFEKVFQTPYLEDGLTIHQEIEFPKEVTCKGALLEEKIDVDQEKIKEVLVGTKEPKLIKTTSINYSDVNNDQSIKKDVIEEVKEFFKLIFEIDSNEFSFSRKFDSNPAHIDKYKEIIKKDLEDKLNDGLKEKEKELYGNKNAELEETLFFYPLVGVLNNLAFEISKGFKG